MDGAQKGFIGHRRADWNAEDAMVFHRPGEYVTLDVQPPTPDLANGLRPLQVVLADAQRGLDGFLLGDVERHHQDAQHPTRGVLQRHFVGADQALLAGRQSVGFFNPEARRAGLNDNEVVLIVAIGLHQIQLGAIAAFDLCLRQAK